MRYLDVFRFMVIPRSIITVALLRLIILLITLVSLAKFNFTKILATDEKN